MDFKAINEVSKATSKLSDNCLVEAARGYVWMGSADVTHQRFRGDFPEWASLEDIRLEWGMSLYKVQVILYHEMMRREGIESIAEALRALFETEIYAKVPGKTTDNTLKEE